MAISDYTKREESDINLKAGNVVEVIEKNEHGELVMKVAFTWAGLFESRLTLTQG